MSSERTSKQQEDLHAAESRATKRRSSMTPKKKWLVVVLLGLCLIAAGIAFFFLRSNSKNVSDTLGRREPQSVGADVKLYIKGRDTIIVAADEKSLNELLAAIPAGTDALQELILSGRVFTVPTGTRARIVEKGFGKTKVRIVEGDRILSEGWVPESWVW